MEKIRVGIIGTGGISYSHMDGYKNMADRVEVVAVCDIDEAKVQAYAAKFSVPRWYTDCHEMMEKESLDCVSVCTWNAAHKECTITALRGGANVICEKPMAMNAAEAEEMRAVAKECGKLLQVGFVRRFGSDADAIRKWNADGITGDIYFAKAPTCVRMAVPAAGLAIKRIPAEVRSSTWAYT